MQKKRDHFWKVIGCALVIVANLVLLTPITKNPMASNTAYAEEAGPATPLKPSPAVYLPVIKSGTPKAPQTEWLAYLNDYRSLAGLPPVSENPGWSLGDQNHARYIVKNDIVEHQEDPGNPWYSPEGHVAAQSGNLMASSNTNTSDSIAIDSWIQAPFHALGILDPGLQQVGFGSYRESDGKLQMSAALDVLRGRNNPSPSVSFPVQFPANGTTVRIGSYAGEYPDPLSSCPGYTAPSGLPIILQVGPGNLSPQVGAHSFKQGSTPLEHCVFSETTYVNSDANAQGLGRSILDSRDAVVLIPRQSLKPGSSYSVSITVDGRNYTWSFNTAGSLNFQDLNALVRFQE